MRRILLTGIGGDVSCAIARSLFEAFPEDEIYGIDIREYTPYMERFTKTFTAPRYTEDTYLSYLKELLRRCVITHFLPTTEPEILIADRNRDYFEKEEIRLLINSSEILGICTSKYETAAFLRKHGIGAPMTGRAEEVKTEEKALRLKEGSVLSYPVILKEDYGRGGHGLLLIKNETEWNAAPKKGYVCQEYIEGPEYTIGVFSDGEIVRSIIFRRELGLGGMSVSVECVSVPAITQLAKQTARALRLCGSFNIQLREKNGNYFVFEINPRLSSTTGFRHKMGFKDAVWWVELSEGKLLSGAYEPPVGMRGVKVTDDMVFSVAGDSEI